MPSNELQSCRSSKLEARSSKPLFTAPRAWAERLAEMTTMRLTDSQRQTIRQLVTDELGSGSTVKLFGSRLDDSARGGDIDLFVEVDAPVEHPAQLSARLSVRIMRAMHGRKVDVLLSAPNLNEQTIHRLAREQGAFL
ncbi:nucleotidyltransferase domain-containing protein [Chromohalobacter sarecensis]|uniref:Nucleotidyltransferase domain-containing protein n=1 Tax=Chromohalobacter sarecensis TaxID=245294 RepID=A0ABV9D459_9GAMM|nr:nucleotidyltransferase domain-containing protein [Chromohalobacter sarecensis]MCK0714426.1 nucleotidyltransferase domain-containing protein [Chromohalobacter sarecensis]